MTDEQRDHFAELKTFAWAAPALLPIIVKRKRISLDLLLMDFRSGKTENLLMRTAELNAFSAIESEITSKQNEYESLEKHYANTDRK